MSEPTRPQEPHFLLAEGFTLPPTLQEGVMPIVNQVIGGMAEHYFRVPLLGSEDRERVFGGRPSRESFACNGFALHTLVTLNEGHVGTEAYIAPPPDTAETDFLIGCLKANRLALPEPDFVERGIDEVAAVLSAAGLSVATGVVLCVGATKPDTSFYTLFVPRVYMNAFSNEVNKGSEEYAVKLAADLMLDLTAIHIQEQKSEAEGNDS